MSTGNLIKIALLGETGVGKTCIIERWVAGSFSARREATRGAAFKSKVVKSPNGENEIKVNVWDTAGQEVYRSLTSLYYKDAEAVLLVYDVTNMKSFNELTYWVEQVRSKASRDCSITIVGNKVDDVVNCQVDSATGARFAKEHNAAFIETSAKNDLNINEVFTQAISHKFPQLMAAQSPTKPVAPDTPVEIVPRVQGSTKLKPQHESDAEKKAARKGCKC